MVRESGAAMRGAAKPWEVAVRVLLSAACIVVLAIPFAGCRRAGESLAERAVEKAMEASSGGKAKVDLSEGKMVVKTAEGETQVGTGGNVSLPAEFPKDIFVYDGAKVMLSIKNPDGYAVSLQSNDKLDKVAAKYREAMPGQGWTEESSMNADKVTILSYKKDGRQTAVSIAGTDDGTQITLTAQNAKKNE
jgi:hypothetical protein